MPPINGKGQSAPILTMIKDVLISMEDQINEQKKVFVLHFSHGFQRHVGLLPSTCAICALITINHCQTDPNAKCFCKINSWYIKRQKEGHPLCNIVTIWPYPPENAYLRHFSKFATKCVIMAQHKNTCKIWNADLSSSKTEKDYDLPFAFKSCNVAINFEDPPYVIL